MGYRAPGAAAKAPSRHRGLFLFSDDAATPRCKDDIIIDDDIECMYNATCRVAMFKALREEPLFQQCVPVYSVFYGSPSKIYFNCQDGELAVPCGALDVLERDMTDIGGDERGDDTPTIARLTSRRRTMRPRCA